jgi:hypothetical protein
MKKARQTKSQGFKAPWLLRRGQPTAKAQI